MMEKTKNKCLIVIFFMLYLLISGCLNQNRIDMQPLKVEVKQLNDKYQLFRAGEPYYIKGAGGSSRLGELAVRGGNSIRTWSTQNARAVLDSAQKYGLTVLMGLDVARERHGFDYDDVRAVNDQLKRLKREVIKYKNHSALLAWGIGNELNLNYTNKKVWDAVDDIAAMIHEVDGIHPVTTMLAGIGKAEIDYIKEHCKNLDFLSIQMYADIINLPQRISESGWNGPYAVTEWGATGHWEVAKTAWGAAIEQTSSERAVIVRERFEKAILPDSINCLGSYVFLWGQKQERTPTWYGLFTENGKIMESADVMQYLWTGRWPTNRVPQIFDVRLEGKTRYDNIRFKAGQQAILTFRSSDFENDQLIIDAELLHESTHLGQGGDFESRPESVANAILEKNPGKVIFNTPDQSGAFRIFIYISDRHNHAATANIPFYVDQ